MFRGVLRHIFPPWARLNQRIVRLEEAIRDLQASKAQQLAEIEVMVNEYVGGAALAQEALHTAQLRALGEEVRHVANDAAVEQAVLAADDARRAAMQHAEALVRDAQEAIADRAHESAVAAAGEALVSATSQSEQLHQQTVEMMDAEVARIRRELVVLGRTRPTSDAARSPAPGGASAVIDDALYVALEDRFRGSAAMISHRLEPYVPLVESLVDEAHPALDLGCGRGEWLRLLGRRGLPVIGVDQNVALAAESREAGIQVVEGDLLGHLRGAADGSFGAVTLFQVVEHLAFSVLVEVLAECVRVLRPGGVLIAETPNSMNLRVAASTFWIDPTHQRPLHPELLKFLATQVGFATIDGWFMNPQVEEEPQGVSASGAGSWRSLVDGPGDFALLAWKA